MSILEGGLIRVFVEGGLRLTGYRADGKIDNGTVMETSRHPDAGLRRAGAILRGKHELCAWESATNGLEDQGMICR
jgi:hypothetical protein